MATSLLALGACADLRSRGEDGDAAGQETRPSRAAASRTGADADADADQSLPFGDAPPLAKARIYEGTGKLIRPNAAAVPQHSASAEGDITLNFVQTDLRDVVRAVLTEILGVNYVIDPVVQGMVTLQTSRPIARSAVLPTLETVLQLNGAAIAADDGLYKIIPLTRAPKSGLIPIIGDRDAAGRSGYGIRILPMEFVGATEMARILEPLASPETILRVDAARNLIIIAGTGQELGTLLATAEIFDVDWLSGMSFGLFPLQSEKPATVIGDLQNIFGDQAEGPLAGAIRFVPIEHMNAVLAISPRAEYLTQARDWVERFDTGEGDGERRTFVYKVQNGRAVDLANVLSQIFTGAAPDSRSPVAPGLTPVELRSRDVGEIRPLQTQLSEQRRATSRQSGDYQRSARDQPQDSQRIIADEINNALVILATPHEYRLVESILRKLDIVPLQVLIEATIAEVTLNNDLRFGLQWFFQTDSGDNSVTSSDGQTTTVAQQFPGFSYLLSGKQNVRLVLNALEEVTDVEVVSSPQLMVLNHQSAILQVGDQVPIATRQSQSVDNPDAPIINTIELRDTGVILQVTPRVNAGGLVILEIIQEVSDVVATTTSTLNSPTIRQRKIESTVAIQSGQTVALGGLIRDTKSQTSGGVPLLSKIPVLGALFGRKTKDSRRTELLVLITPRVVRNQADALQVTQELRNRMRAISPLAQTLGRQ